VLFFWYQLVTQIAPCLKKTPTIEIKAKIIQEFMARMTMLLLMAHLVTCLWIRVLNEGTSEIFGIYISALYFLFTTASTTGYGDITVDKNLASDDTGLYVWASFVILFGLNYFVIFIAYNKKIIEDFNLQESIKTQTIEEVEDWFAVRNQTSGAQITWHFEKLVKEFHFYLVNKDIVSKLSYGEYYDKLAYSMQMRIQLYIANDLISAFEIFKILPVNIATNLALQYTSLQ
jgi:hypothetical protein